MLFYGSAECILDSKQRLAIPAKWRSRWDADRDGVGWVCIPWPTGILRLFTQKEFHEKAQQIRQNLPPEEDEEAPSYFGFAELLELDGQGRLTIPKKHIELTGLKREVVAVGAGDRLEIRPRDVWLGGEEERFSGLPEHTRTLRGRQEPSGA